ncbi:MAG: RluA family pseudouridine synthase [Clostridiales bacterium]|nr:RluA family pseudouridine synthase [Clostridiales bacterium]
MNLFEIVAQQSDQGKKVSAILRGQNPLAPSWVLQKALKNKDVKINGVKVSKDEKVQAGDHIRWYSLWKEPDFPVIFEDENILIINKPSGISSDQQSDGAMSIESWALSQEAYIVHRLDQQTSGLLVLAKNDVIKLAIEEAMANRTIITSYQCLVYGVPLSKHAILQAYLIKDAKRNEVRVTKSNSEFAKQIITEYDILEAKGDSSRLLITLHTGRTHQIRAHLAFSGYPILGDDKYGSRDANRLFKCKRLMLAATIMNFQTEGKLSYLKGRCFEVDAPF